MTRTRLHTLYGNLQKRLASELDAARSANDNPNAKGDASENTWIQFFNDHLPERYKSIKGIVIDSNGAESDAIDIVIHDRQYTPRIYNQHGYPYVPAEAVYAVLEAKQELDRELVKYAGQKAASVRRLQWTSARVPSASGILGPVLPFVPLAGIVAYQSAWKEPFGGPFRKAIANLQVQERLDLGIAAAHGSFEVDPKTGQVRIFPGERALSAFLIRLLGRLQQLGTVPAIDYAAYGRALE